MWLYLCRGTLGLQRANSGSLPSTRRVLRRIMAEIDSSRDQHGSFVFGAGAHAVPVYDGPTCSRHTANLKPWQVVSSTKLQSDVLQLEDGSGWVKICQMIPLTVEHTGLRLYRTGHHSISRRYHPDHDVRIESDPGVTGIVVTSCRVKGTNGTYFVRLDGNPSCWLPETCTDGKPLLFLVEDLSLPVGASSFGHHAITDTYRGLAVWRVEDGPVAVYSASGRSGAPCGTLQPGTVFSSVTRLLERGSRGGGPDVAMIFVEDGAGWVCEQQEAGKGRLRPVSVDYTRNRYRVNNGDVGLALRTRPDHDSKFRKDPEVVVNGTVWSYARVVGSTGDVYVRVEGKAGWLFESRDNERMLVRLEEGDSQADSDVPSSGDKPGHQLNLETARQIAKHLGWSEISCNEVSRAVSFSQDDMRVNVYYTTGTVGTCLDHPVHGKTQMFRREVSLNELAAIFKSPRVHLSKGHKHREHMPLPLLPPAAMDAGRGGPGGGTANVPTNNGRGGAVVVPSEEDALKAQIIALTQKASEALEERSSLVWQLKVVRAAAQKEAVRRAEEAKHRAAEEAKQKVEEAKRKAEEQEQQKRVRARLEDERKAKALATLAALVNAQRASTSYGFALHNWIMASFSNALLAGTIQDVAITADSYMILYTDGRAVWCGGIPQLLDHKLRERLPSLPRPMHVALGPKGTDCYCVIFEDGSYSAIGPQALFEALNRGGVCRVTLGPNGTWLALYKDGTQAWSCGLPKGLHDQLYLRNPALPKPVFVDLGPAGEWFVSYADGAWGADGYRPCVGEAIRGAQLKGQLGRVWFGDDGTYVVACRTQAPPVFP